MCLWGCSKPCNPSGAGSNTVDGSPPSCPCDTPTVWVSEIQFQGAKDIYYARIPAPDGSFLLPASEDATPVHKLFTPIAKRPQSGPHWRKKPGATPEPEFSWPAVYIRSGGSGPSPTLKARFEFQPANCSGTVKVKAKSTTGIEIAEKTILFSAGQSELESFDLQNLPGTVKRLDGIEFTWSFTINSVICATRRTKHTLFIVDKQPKAATYHTDSQLLWEIFEWSCKWADGVTGHQHVLDAIWAQFSPVKAHHDTGLIYWKDHEHDVPPYQELARAIRGWNTNNDAKNSASCVVFDEIFMDCLAAHGISSAEVMLEAPFTKWRRENPGRTPLAPPPTFTRDGHTFVCTRWKDKTINAQGNSNAPPFWANHWIADVNTPGTPSWKFFDPSYGAGPTNATEPATGAEINIQSYEPETVSKFEVLDTAAPPRPDDTTPLPQVDRNPDPAVPPHLTGTILWTNK